MTEEEWEACNDPNAMILHLTERCDIRTWRLFAIESCRAVLLGDGEFHPALNTALNFGEMIAEDFAAASWDEYAKIRRAFDEALGEMSEAIYCLAMAAEVAIYPHILTFGDGQRVVESIASAFLTASGSFNGDEQFAHQAMLLRDIFGSPFDRPYFKPALLTPTVAALAGAIYTDRAYDRLPILADALEEAGCDIAAVLSHCRGPGPHVRGCWVVDLVLGKS